MVVTLVRMWPDRVKFFYEFSYVIDICVNVFREIIQREVKFLNQVRISHTVCAVFDTRKM